ncbi:MAG: hypothetical protein ACYS80_07555, partial [Planctomycetota bacterium]
MKHHLTERELIEYRFRLTSENQMSTSARHLADCAECRQRLEQLNRKFAALDFLREDIEVSEELISQVAEQARQPSPKKVVLFRKYPWITAVAAVLVVGFVLLIGNLTQERQTQPDLAKRAEPEEKASYRDLKPLDKTEVDPTVRIVAKGLEEGTESPLAGDFIAGDVTKEKYAMDMPKEKAPIMEHLHRETTIGGTGSTAPESISEQPPFAPASAIELVTLPRRDKVQLTIYNSADLTLVRERRNLTLKKGWNWLQFMWANTLIDPTSLNLEPLEQGDKIDIQQLV